MQRRFPIKLSSVNIFNNNATRNLAVIAIAGYQKFISPYKGFSCAHRVLYGCESCSQYFKRVIAEEGLSVAIANAKGRFQECREANEILKSRRAKCGKHRKKQNKYFASRLSANILAIESVDPENPEGTDPQNPDPENPDSQEPDNTKKKKLSGSRWKRKQKEVANNNNNNINNRNNPCDYCDCIDCSYALDACDCLNTDNMNCPNLDCGNADCFSGMDCSGCGDCGSCN